MKRVQSYGCVQVRRLDYVFANTFTTGSLLVDKSSNVAKGNEEQVDWMRSSTAKQQCLDMKHKYLKQSVWAVKCPELLRSQVQGYHCN